MQTPNSQPTNSNPAPANVAPTNVVTTQVDYPTETQPLLPLNNPPAPVVNALTTESQSTEAKPVKKGGNSLVKIGCVILVLLILVLAFFIFTTTR